MLICTGKKSLRHIKLGKSAGPAQSIVVLSNRGKS